MTETIPAKPSRPGADLWRRFRTHRGAIVGLILLTVVSLMVWAGPLVWSVDPNLITLADRNLPPSATHPMGTDELGRDLLARVLDGGRLTLAVALAAVMASITLGLVVGATAGYLGGIVDNLLMRLVDVFYSLPSLFVVILLVLVLGAGFWPIVIAIALFTWMNTARIVRASVLSIKEREYVEAARSLGAGHARVLLGHVLPGTFGPLVVTATLNIAFAILTESALSFLGLGFQPPQSTWGGLLFEAQRAVISEGHWWRGFFPGLMIFAVVLAVNYIGDGLSDALDPRRRKR
ncbi:MAG TPA: ABC transporter permease [Microcella sp.]|nr:ABC transporter permease [Microcella sp.]